MNPAVQITIALAINLIISIILGIVHRSGRAAWWTASLGLALLTVAGAASVMTGFDLSADPFAAVSQTASEEKRTESKYAESEDGEDPRSVITALIEMGETQKAADLLEEYLEQGNYSPETLALMALLAEEEGDVDKADHIREALRGAGYKVGDLTDAFETPGKDAKRAAEGYSAAVELAKEDTEDAETLRQDLDDWCGKNAPFAADFPSLRRAYLAGELYSENYSELARNLMQDPDGDELIVLTELLKNDKIGASKISDSEAQQKTIENAVTVMDWIDRELEQNANAYTDEETDILTEKSRKCSETADGGRDTLMEYLSEQMESKAEEAGEDASKLYLELADLAYENHNSSKAEEYVEKALETAAFSEDGDYSAAAGKLTELMYDADVEARKQITGAAEILAAYRMPETVPAVAMSGSTNSASFTGNLSTTVNQITGSVSIVGLDVTDFPELKAQVSVSDAIARDETEFRQQLTVTDTDCVIDSYSVKKMTYSEVNVILVCDISGSMEGDKIDCLRDAVKNYIGKADAQVRIGLVPFNGCVVTDSVLTLDTDRNELEEKVGELQAGGGTNIYDAVEYAFGMFPVKDDTLNLMLVMSDGNSNEPGDEQFAHIRTECRNRSVTLYALGLGSDVDANQMKEYADYGGGQYYFIDDASTIDSFYDYIYDLSKNRYLLTYDAADTALMTGRYLEVGSRSNLSVKDRYDYTLYENALEDDQAEQLPVTLGDVTISGLKEKMIYPTQCSQTVTLLGDNFEKDAVVSVELHGTSTFSAESVEWQDKQNYAVVIPGNIPTGLYDVYVTYNGKRRIFQSALIVSGGDTNVIRFGEYVFTATNVARGSNTVTMSGIVTMNGWLGFKDSVTLTGDLDRDYQITMDCGKTYMQYNGSASGLAKYYAKHGYTTSLPAFDSIALYNDQTVSGSSEDYPVQTIAPEGIYVLIDVCSFEANSLGLSIYPDRAVLDFQAFSTKFPLQDVIVRKTKADELFDFNIDRKEQLILSNNAIDCDLEISLNNNRKKDFNQLKLGNMKFYANPGSAEVKLNTKEGEISVKLTANIAMLADGLGFEIAWKDWTLDAINLYADYKLTTYIGNIPVTVRKFSLGLNDISKVDLGSDITSLFSMQLVGKCDISMAEISAVWPGLKDWLDDASIASLEDCTLGFRLKEFRISAEATAKLLGFVELAHAKAQLGFALDYTNSLLELQDTPNGAYVEVDAGPDIELSNARIVAKGSGSLALTDQIIGLDVGGELETEIHWWVFVAEWQARGDLFVGAYRQHDGEMSFVLLAQGASTSGRNSVSVVWGNEDEVLANRKI